MNWQDYLIFISILVNIWLGFFIYFKSKERQASAEIFEKTKELNVRLKEERKRKTKELIDTGKKLRKLDKTKSEFISIASHQLRTPLTSVKGFASLLLEEAYGKMSKDQKEIVNKIYISNERLILLVEDLLNMSRIERGEMKYEFQEVAIKDLIQSVVALMNVQVKSRGLYLKFHNKIKGNVEVTVKADYKKLAETIGNLINNAMQYTSKGGIDVFLEEKDGQVKVSVSDTGIGILANDIPKLFEKFSRGKGVSELHTEGTGLGLYIARKITEAHGGKIGVESPGKGKGSTFYLELPKSK